eukprot:TRINITY_DN2194_c0_g1_i4.p1 TRINITY_DN2194_c0_g1~~TRINITY_DN2194_c0_g1_i4.p1  ORF type:complete len:244 (+),score=81.89 TRINITY_DN2194_c0_g1_i4:85-816(+)
MIRRPPRSTLSSSSAASDVYKRQYQRRVRGTFIVGQMMMLQMLQTVLLLVPLADGSEWVWDQASIPKNDPNIMAGMKDENAARVFDRCQEEISKRCADAVADASSEPEPTSEAWVDAYVGRVEECVNHQADELSPHCSPKAGTAVDWRGYNPSEWRAKLRRTLGQATKQAVLRARVRAAEANQRANEEVAKADQRAILGVKKAQQRAAEEIARVKANAAKAQADGPGDGAAGPALSMDGDLPR